MPYRCRLMTQPPCKMYDMTHIVKCGAPGPEISSALFAENLITSGTSRSQPVSSFSRASTVRRNSEPDRGRFISRALIARTILPAILQRRKEARKPVILEGGRKSCIAVLKDEVSDVDMDAQYDSRESSSMSSGISQSQSLSSTLIGRPSVIDKIRSSPYTLHHVRWHNSSFSSWPAPRAGDRCQNYQPIIFKKYETGILT